MLDFSRPHAQAGDMVLGRTAAAAALSGLGLLVAACSADSPSEVPGHASSAPGTSSPSQSFTSGLFAEGFTSATSLRGWQIDTGDVMSGGPPRATVSAGALHLRPAQSRWLDSFSALGVKRTVTGDIDVSALVATRGVHSPEPTVDWSLSGLMLRDPSAPSPHWLHWSVGHVGGPVLERKETWNGESDLHLIHLPKAGPVQLRIIRTGGDVVLAHRQGKGGWTVDYTYASARLPDTVDLLVTAQSGSLDDHADLVADIDWVRAGPVLLTAADRQAVEAGNAAPLNATAETAPAP